MYNTSIEQHIKENGEYIITPVGVSMWPLLRNRRDTVYVEKYTGTLDKYDIVVFRRNKEKIIMHRCIGMENDTYIMCGDNEFRKERGIKKEQIIAVAKGIYRDEKYIPCTNRVYRLLVRIWCLNLFARRCILFILRRTKPYKKVFNQLMSESKLKGKNI